jgi:hypothetical protein
MARFEFALLRFCVHGRGVYCLGMSGATYEQKVTVGAPERKTALARNNAPN